MSKTFKDFGEVLVALSQGRTVIDSCGRRVNIFDEWFQAYCEEHDDWLVLESEDIDFDYPAPIYEEPKTVEIDMWVNVYHWGFSHLGYLSREQADKEADTPHRIACINIKRTVTEGEGLE
jgi:hypothetical protein